MDKNWRPIPGFDGWYEVSRFGEVRSWIKLGHPGVRADVPRIMHPIRYKKSGSRAHYTVSLVDPDGKQQKKQVKYLIRDVWMDGPVPGKLLVFLDGDPSNCSVSNLKYMTVKEKCKKHRTGNPKPVFKVDVKTNEVVEVYRSIAEAGRKHYISTDGMWKRIKYGTIDGGYKFVKEV